MRAVKTILLFILIVLMAIPFIVQRYASPLADTILANAIKPLDREYPATIRSWRQGPDNIVSVSSVGDGLSCSLPPGVDSLIFSGEDFAPISLRMRQACAYHDMCYRHGEATYGYTQADCDYFLQKHAFRLCRQIHMKFSIERCETEARKLTLGVRIGGAGSFRSASASDPAHRSTYHEFEAFPETLSTYTSVRVADAPANWPGAEKKAVFVFNIKPNGIELTIRARSIQSSQTFCTRLQLGALPDALTSPPIVARTNDPDRTWFVWWRRYALSTTGGTLSGLDTRLASLDDWRQVFQSARYVKDSGSTPSRFACRNALPFHGPESVQFSNRSFDKKTPEFFAVPPDDNEPTTKIRLYGLSSGECDGEAKYKKQDVGIGNCLTYLGVDTVDLKSPRLERTSFASRDPGCMKGAPPGSCNRYRLFVSSPNVVGSGSRAVLAVFRRGDNLGEGYLMEAQLRLLNAKDPLSPDKQRMPNYGQLNLAEFGEVSEPVAWAPDPKERDRYHLIALRKDWKCQGLWLDDLVLNTIQSGYGFVDLRKRCIQGLTKDWINHPWFMLENGHIVLVKRSVLPVKVNDLSGFVQNIFDIVLETQVLDVTGEQIQLTKAQRFITSRIYAGFKPETKNKKNSDLWIWTLNKEKNQTEYFPDPLAQQKDIAAYVNFIVARQALTLSDLDGDLIPEIVSLDRRYFGTMKILSGRLNADKLEEWEVPATDP